MCGLCRADNEALFLGCNLSSPHFNHQIQDSKEYVMFGDSNHWKYFSDTDRENMFEYNTYCLTQPGTEFSDIPFSFQASSVGV